MKRGKINNKNEEREDKKIRMKRRKIKIRMKRRNMTK